MPPRPIRIRKARKASTLACGCYVRTGHVIASRDGEPWICIEHLATRRGGAPDGELQPVDNAHIRGI